MRLTKDIGDSIARLRTRKWWRGIRAIISPEGRTNALDDLCSLTSALAGWTREFSGDRRLYTHTFSDRSDHIGDPVAQRQTAGGLALH